MPVVTTASQVGPQRAVTIMGIIAATRRVRTRRGETMLFLTLEDPTGLVECTLFPPVYRRLGGGTGGGVDLLAEGRFAAPSAPPTVTVERLESLA